MCQRVFMVVFPYWSVANYVYYTANSALPLWGVFRILLLIKEEKNLSTGGEKSTYSTK